MLNIHATELCHRGNSPRCTQRTKRYMAVDPRKKRMSSSSPARISDTMLVYS